MTDDLLDALGRLAREERATHAEDDARWQPHAAGAPNAVPNEDDELTSLYRPIGDDVRRSMADRALAELGKAPVAAVVRPLRPRARTLLLLAATLATGLGLWLVAPRSTPLPAYDVSVGGPSAEWRAPAPPDAPPGGRIAPDADLEVVLRPRSRVDGPLEARAHVVHGGAEGPWRGAIDVSPQGAVRLTGGPVRELFEGAHGPVEIVVSLAAGGGSGDGKAAPPSRQTRTIRVSLVIE